MTHDSRTIQLTAPLEIYSIPTVHMPFPTSYTVTGLRIEHSGDVEAMAFDYIGRPVSKKGLRAELAKEAIRVLGLQKQVSQRPRQRRRRVSDLIPHVWGLTLRGVGPRPKVRQAS